MSLRSDMVRRSYSFLIGFFLPSAAASSSSSSSSFAAPAADDVPAPPEEEEERKLDPWRKPRRSRRRDSYDRYDLPAHWMDTSSSSASSSGQSRAETNVMIGCGWGIVVVDLLALKKIKQLSLSYSFYEKMVLRGAGPLFSLPVSCS